MITGEKIRSLSEEGFINGSIGGSRQALFSPDSKYFALVGLFTPQVKIWDVATGWVFRTIGSSELPPNTVFIGSSIAFSSDGSSLGISSMGFSAGKQLGGKLLLFDLAPGKPLKELNVSGGNIEFSPDNKLAAISDMTNDNVELWNIAQGVKLREFVGHSQGINSMVFSPDGTLLVTGSSDRTTKLWDVSSGKELATLITFDSNDWLVVTPEGLFDGTPNAWKQLNWRFDNNTFRHAPVEAFFKEFYYPGLLQEVAAGRKPLQPKTNLSQVDIRQPQVEIAAIDGKPVASQKEIPITNRTVKVTVEITDNQDKARQASVTTASGAQDVRLFRNGSLVKVWHGDVLKGKTGVTLDAAIPIVAGENNLTAYAFNRDNVKSSDATLAVTGADSLKRKGTAYVLAVGVNEYSNTQYNLRYAVPDARDFAGELKRQQEKLGVYERVEVISLNDKNATKANILKALAGLSAKIQPEDALVIFFAGHGTAQQNRFYLIPHDLGYAGSRTQLDNASLKNILAHSISDEELERAVEGIDAGQMLLVIDACNSGQALEAEEKRRGPMNSKGLAQLAYEKGMYILTAAESYQAAKEAAKLGHGFLTYALVEEGLKTNAADREPKDGQVLLREWLDFATERVPQMQQDEIKKRQLVQEKSGAAVRPNEDNLQRPRVFYRRETEPHPLVVARP
jgi:ureidoglycolate hydrolase